METADEIIAAITAELGPTQQTFAPGGEGGAAAAVDPFADFRGRTITAFPESDQRIVRSIVSAEIRRARQRRDDESVLFRALTASRDRLLAADSGLSVSARDFIKDHCPCG